VSSAADRQRAFRARSAAGKAVLAIEVDLVDTEELLIAEGLLALGDRDDREAVARAAERLWAALLVLHRNAQSQ
jgi:hypothetical protein